MNEIRFAKASSLAALEDASGAMLAEDDRSVLADDNNADPVERIDFIRARLQVTMLR
ncbi:hypothetical protein [Mesorhizobium sp. M0040]|uniref:hypothetical protein n=1 Tax=Mesorhizobium sp. M0040 TaxID=2956855 RepID=UPI0033366125